MPQFSLTTAEWTPIVAAGGADAVHIAPRFGTALISLNTATDDGARRLVMPPIPPTPSPTPSEVTHLRVAAGVAVFARAVRDPAMVYVGGAAK